MSTTTVSCNPNFLFRLSPLPNSKLKPISFLHFPASKRVLFCPPISRPSLSQRVWGPKTMTDLIRVSSFRSHDDIEDFGALETEAILSNGSLRLKSGGLESTLNRLSKWLVTFLFGATILWRHDAEALWAGMGSVLNVLLSLTLKRTINQVRPFSTSKSDPGMPSSHAQSIFYAVIFAIISMIKFLGVNEVTVSASVIVLASGSYFSWLRVSQKLHTINQVIVGAIVGAFFSILWFQLWDAVVLNAFISYLWVRITVVLGSVGFCLGFTIYAFQHWLANEQEAL